ncbi:RNA polymerase-associated protein LEO1-like isoform X2 [Orbicella faveolata]|uniref:RNA polymerase-associated protein LEO1-like isoform X2 n=1 Tax=Orbicella faveolata TaxID=48498 RepID=UPI0009E1CC19|nr:RNA polymerase-associated protein LEO1-like isoform X2 [Orbicella faveolata]
MNLFELRDALSALGYRLSNTALSSIHVQYHNKKGTIPFDIFIQILVRVIMMFEPLDRGVARIVDSNTPLIPGEDKEMKEAEEVVLVAEKKNQEKEDRMRLATSSFLLEEEEETDKEEEKKRSSFFQESPSGSMTKMQVNVEMDDLTKEKDHPTIKFVQPNRKGNDNGDGEGNGDNNGKGDADGDGDDDGNRNGHARAHGNAKENLIKIIERGNIDEITQELTPKAMAKCGRNALLVAMEVC